MNFSHAFNQTKSSAQAYGTAAAVHDLAYRAVNRIMTVQVLKGMTAVAANVNKGLVVPHDLHARFATKDELLAVAGDAYEMTQETFGKVYIAGTHGRVKRWATPGFDAYQFRVEHRVAAS